jgi:hypothetical protein
MKLNPFLALLIVLLSVVYAKAQHDDFANKISTKAFNPSTVSWYNAPAKKWEDALPVGNGRTDSTQRRNLLVGRALLNGGKRRL